MGRVETGGEVAAVLLAGGAGTRFDAGRSKVYVRLGDRPMLAHSLATLDRSPLVDHLVLVVRAGDETAAAEVVRSLGPRTLRAVVTGGSTRTESESAGLGAVRGLSSVGWVMLHDAARPLLTPDLLERIVATARAHDVGVVPAAPLGEAVVDDDGRLVDTSTLVTVQTPQLFAVEDVTTAYERAAADGFHGVDTAETVATYRDRPIATVPGDPRNLKITTRDDLATVEGWLADRARGR